MAAQTQVYQLYSDKLFVLCLKYSKNYQDAEDTLQDSFLIIFDKIKQYKNKGSFEGWLKRITINTALQKYREKSPLQLVKDIEEFDEVIEIDIENSFNSVVSTLKDKLLISEISFTTDFSNCKSIKFAESYFKSMIHNILNNAIKYKSLKRDLQISVKSFSIDNFNCISITDNGIGIDLQEHGEHVFGLFKRANDNTEGSGLALYLIKKIVEKTGGKIDVESELDKGSTFTLFFKK